MVESPVSPDQFRLRPIRRLAKMQSPHAAAEM
jgi:hypothetical protein